MARVVSDPYTQVANVIEATVRSEFNNEQFLNIMHDRLHESVGSDGALYVGISPEDEATSNLELRLTVLIQFYDGFTPEVNPHQAVDPRIIANKAERLRLALAEVRTVGTPEVWFFNVNSTRYPPDATGNKTRFEMLVEAWGQNSAFLLETGP